MRKSFKFKIKQNEYIFRKIDKWISMCQFIYNLDLETRIKSYRETGKTIKLYLPEFKKQNPEFKQIDSQTLQNIQFTLDRAFQSFFRRIKKGVKPGFPRFRSKSRLHSFTLVQASRKPNGNILIIRNLGKIKFFKSREIEGDVKTITIKRYLTGDYYVIFSCDNVSNRLLPKTNKEIGIDMGCESFLTRSNGKKIDNPRFLKHSEDKLKERQRLLSKKKKGSKRRFKCKFLFAKIHQKISNQRRDFQFKVANHLIKQFDKIYIEKLQSWNSYRNLNKSMRDVSWFNFFNILKFKAEEAGRQVIEVNPRNTSKTCSLCGNVKEDLTLSDRVYKCESCGISQDRDYNAACNILRLGQSLQKSISENSPLLEECPIFKYG